VKIVNAGTCGVNVDWQEKRRGDQGDWLTKQNEEIRYLRGKSRLAGVARPPLREENPRGKVELKAAVFDLQKISVSRYRSKNRGTIGSEMGSQEVEKSS
jgi:hypothetical protein